MLPRYFLHLVFFCGAAWQVAQLLWELQESCPTPTKCHRPRPHFLQRPNGEVERPSTVVVSPSMSVPSVATIGDTSAASLNGVGQPQRAHLPKYDVVAMIMATGSKKDQLLMDAAAGSWLNSASTTTMTFMYFMLLCHDDPAVACEGGSRKPCVSDRKDIAVLPCKHGYHHLTSKSIEGYRYVAANFEFRYVLKADVDSVVDLKCIVRALGEVSKTCASFGMGLWRVAGDSKVFGPNDPNGGKYSNAAFLQDTGSDAYPPYMTGWLMIWSSDVARFLGMAGLSKPEMPRWRTTWTIDDAAIGTFVLGLNLCRLPLTCPVVTDQTDRAIAAAYAALDESNTTEAETGPDGSVKHFRGPLHDDIPGVGDIANVEANSLAHCAAKCLGIQICRSFEYSSLSHARSGIRKCQLNTQTRGTGAKFLDYSLYIRD